MRSVVRHGFALFLSLIWSGGSWAGTIPVEKLLAGVREIAAPGWPGSVVVYGPNAAPLVAGRVGGRLEPVVAASTLGRGRVVVFGHGGYLSREAAEQADTGALLVNAARWAAAGSSKPVATQGNPGLAAYLREHGVAASVLNAPWTADALRGCGAVVCVPSQLEEGERAALGRFVRAGGGLLAAETGWGWQQITGGKPIDENPGNRLLRDAGVGWGDAGLERTSKSGFAAGAAPSDMLNASRALAAIEAAPDGAGLEQAVATVAAALRCLPADDRTLRPRLRSLAKRLGAVAIPRGGKPVSAADPMARLALTMEVEDSLRLPPGRLRPSRAAADFPGSVAPSAPRVTRTVQVDTRVPNWHSTGLYAAPGDVITVETPAKAVGKGLRVRIGCHTDALWSLEKWDRAPEITRSFPLASESTKAANAFGGLVYVEAPVGSRLGMIDVTIRGAVEAPRYVRGRTDLAEWRSAIRRRPGPWAEIEGQRAILSVPSSVVRNLDDPGPVAEFWDRVVEACDDLAGTAARRTYPERYVADRQISAGYMHSGYPIMTWLDVAPLVVDIAKLRREGSWGHFHEMGHNHQNGDWTFEGTGEVTENLFSMYCYEKVLGLPFDQGHPAIRDRAKRAERARAYIAAGADFEKWKADPFLALTMYIELIDAFGWEPYKEVFAEYLRLPANERPRTDDEKRDQWMVRMSKAVGRNLGPFFAAWGVPTSEKARAEIAHLPVWMPAELSGR